jgi:hypothetical protein
MLLDVRRQWRLSLLAATGVICDHVTDDVRVELYEARRAAWIEMDQTFLDAKVFDASTAVGTR